MNTYNYWTDALYKHNNPSLLPDISVKKLKHHSDIFCPGIHLGIQIQENNLLIYKGFMMYCYSILY